jgi:hypothetical protein
LLCSKSLLLHPYLPLLILSPYSNSSPGPVFGEGKSSLVENINVRKQESQCIHERETAKHRVRMDLQ